MRYLQHLVLAAALMSIVEGAAAQGGAGAQNNTRYSIDGPGGGVATSTPPATRPVPPATRAYPYPAARGRGPAPVPGQSRNLPLTSR